MKNKNFIKLWNDYACVYNDLAEYFEDNRLSIQKLRKLDQVVEKLFIICNIYMK